MLKKEINMNKHRGTIITTDDRGIDSNPMDMQ